MEKNKPSFLSCAKRQQRWAIRKLSIGVCSVLLGVMLMVPSLGTVYAQENRGLDTTTHYTATGIDNNANHVIALLFSIKLRMTTVYL